MKIVERFAMIVCDTAAGSDANCIVSAPDGLSATVYTTQCPPISVIFNRHQAVLWIEWPGGSVGLQRVGFPIGVLPLEPEEAIPEGARLERALMPQAEQAERLRAIVQEILQS